MKQLTKLKNALSFLKKTPLHPQWLLNKTHGFESHLPEYKNKSILDIGSADRWPEKRLGENCTYIALDYLETGKNLYSSKPDIFADASSLPFTGQSIDVVLLFDVLEHLDKHRETLLEIFRVLKPNGQLLLSIPFLYPIHDAPFDFQRFTSHGLEREINISGLKIVFVQPSLSSIETGALNISIAITGEAYSALKNKKLGSVLVPFLLVLIPFINVTAWTLARFFNTWTNATSGYTVKAIKP